jgi:hypothetical protein
VAAAGPGRRTPTPLSPVSTARDRMSPLTVCPGVTPVTGHPGHGCVRGPPDTAVSPDLPGNHQGTAGTHARDVAVAGLLVGRSGAEVEEFFSQLAARSPRWQLTAGQRKRLAQAVTSALAAGWTPDGLAGFAGASTAGIRNPVAVLATRLMPAELSQPPLSRRAPWCGRCDERTRMLGFDTDAPAPCPRARRPQRRVGSPSPAAGARCRGPRRGRSPGRSGQPSAARSGARPSPAGSRPTRDATMTSRRPRGHLFIGRSTWAPSVPRPCKCGSLCTDHQGQLLLADGAQNSRSVRLAASRPPSVEALRLGRTACRRLPDLPN